MRSLACFPSRSSGRRTTAAPRRAAATATAGAPPLTTLTQTRNLDSVLVAVSRSPPPGV